MEDDLSTLWPASSLSSFLTHLKKHEDSGASSATTDHTDFNQASRGVLGLLSPCSTKMEHFWAAHMGSCFLASSTPPPVPPGLAGFFTQTLGINVWSAVLSLLHLLTRAWLEEAHSSAVYPTGHSEDPSAQSHLFLGPPASWLPLFPLLLGSADHSPQSVSSSQTLSEFSPWLLLLPL